MKKLLAVGVIGLFLGLACAPSINANVSKPPADIDSIADSREIYGMDDKNLSTHMFCFIKSGYVDHHCPYEFWHGTFFGFQTKIGNGIGTIGVGSLYMHLTNFPDKPEEPRLIVSKILRPKVYTEDINVSVKGFIGAFQPTGHLSDGLFFGFAMITRITPLKN